MDRFDLKQAKSRATAIVNKASAKDGQVTITVKEADLNGTAGGRGGDDHRRGNHHHGGNGTSTTNLLAKHRESASSCKTGERSTRLSTTNLDHSVAGYEVSDFVHGPGGVNTYYAVDATSMVNGGGGDNGEAATIHVDDTTVMFKGISFDNDDDVTIGVTETDLDRVTISESRKNSSEDPRQRPQPPSALSNATTLRPRIVRINSIQESSSNPTLLLLDSNGRAKSEQEGISSQGLMTTRDQYEAIEPAVNVIKQQEQQQQQQNQQHSKRHQNAGHKANSSLNRLLNMAQHHFSFRHRDSSPLHHHDSLHPDDSLVDHQGGAHSPKQQQQQTSPSCKKSKHNKWRRFYSKRKRTQASLEERERKKCAMATMMMLNTSTLDDEDEDYDEEEDGNFREDQERRITENNQIHNRNNNNHLKQHPPTRHQPQPDLSDPDDCYTDGIYTGPKRVGPEKMAAEKEESDGSLNHSNGKQVLRSVGSTNSFQEAKQATTAIILNSFDYKQLF